MKKNHNYLIGMALILGALFLCVGSTNAQSKKDKIKAIITSNQQYPEMQYENDFYAKQYAYHELKTDSTLMSQDSAGIFQHFTDSVAPTDMGKLEEVALQIKNHNTINAAFANAFVTGAALFENNLKKINTIYLATIAQEQYEFDASQKADLLNMAYSDPLLSGPAVYLARVMLDINPDDGAAGSGKTDQEEETNNEQLTTNNYQLYPNPNNGTMTLEYSLGKDETGLFFLFDLQGRRLFSYPLKPETKGRGNPFTRPVAERGRVCQSAPFTRPPHDRKR